MEISARNQLRGTVTAIKLGAVMAQITVRVGASEVVSAITRESVDRLGIKVTLREGGAAGSLSTPS